MFKSLFLLIFNIAEMWVVVDKKIPRLNGLHLHGKLEFSNQLPQINLNVAYIHIRGGRLILGWENDPYTGEAVIELRGTQKTPSFPIISGPNLGSNFIGNHFLYFFSFYGSAFLLKRTYWNCYHRRKWTQRSESKTWTRLFRIALTPLRKVWIQLF